MTDEVKTEQDTEVPKYVKEVIQLTFSQELEPDQIRERSFHLLNGQIVAGLLLAETNDSFLVGLGGLFYRESEKSGLKFNPISKNSRVRRFMKAGVAMVGFLDPAMQKALFEYLVSVAADVPDLLTDIRCDIMRKRLASLSGNKVSSLNDTENDDVEAEQGTFASLPGYMRDYNTTRH